MTFRVQTRHTLEQSWLIFFIKSLLPLTCCYFLWFIIKYSTWKIMNYYLLGSNVYNMIPVFIVVIHNNIILLLWIITMYLDLPSYTSLHKVCTTLLHIIMYVGTTLSINLDVAIYYYIRRMGQYVRYSLTKIIL